MYGYCVEIVKDYDCGDGLVGIDGVVFLVDYGKYCVGYWSFDFCVVEIGFSSGN